MKGYPTLAYFRYPFPTPDTLPPPNLSFPLSPLTPSPRAGSKMETYKGARTLAELKEFVTTTKGEAGKAASEDGKVGGKSLSPIVWIFPSLSPLPPPPPSPRCRSPSRVS